MTDINQDAFFRLSQLREDQIDLAEGALLIARDAYPDLNIDMYLQQLDQMAAETQLQMDRKSDAIEQIQRLNHYLFEEKGFAGNQDDYYAVHNSYLNRVLELRLGIPITLSILYIEVGRRIGLPLVGVGFPGHFIVKHKYLETFVDAFDGGKILSEEALLEKLAQVFRQPVPMEPQFLRETPKKQILARVLRNLKQIHFKRKEYEKAIRAGEKITWLEPQSAQDCRDLGYLYYQVNAYTKSLAAFETYLRLSDDPPDQEEISRNIRVLAQQLATLN